MSSYYPPGTPSGHCPALDGPSRVYAERRECPACDGETSGETFAYPDGWVWVCDDCGEEVEGEYLDLFAD
jgi:hypothetical protein